MTVAELREQLLHLDQKSQVLLNDSYHFFRKTPIARIEEDFSQNFSPPAVVLVPKES